MPAKPALGTSSNTDDRSALHVHGMSHGGLSPGLLTDVAADSGLRKQAMDALDTQLQAELPLEYHAIYLAHFTSADVATLRTISCRPRGT